jgi:carboxylesterase type B
MESNCGQKEAFLPQQPLDMIISGQINAVPWLMGTVSNEGAGAAVGENQ